jgi:uncharacterized protein
MKYLLLIAIILGGIWLIRQQRSSKVDRAQHARHGGPQTMLPCAHCGTHAPENDVVQGRRGVYCSKAHRQAAEG